jgi:hypothetical protein
VKALAVATLVALSLGSVTYADDLDDLMGDFEETSIDTSVEDTVVEEDSWFAFSGDYTFSTAYNYDSAATVEGLSRLRNTLNLNFDMELSKNWKSKIEMKFLADPVYQMRDITGYTESLEVEDQYENLFKEAYVQGSMGKFDMKLGRQITVWGKSDNIRITDIINPLDNREAGMVDIKDLRLPVTTSKFSYFAGDLAFNLSVIHEARREREATVGSEFFPTSMFPVNFPGVPAITDVESNLENTQYAASIDGTFSGWDLSLYAANVLNQKWHLENNFTLRTYSMITMGGFALNIASGAWIFKTEAALLGDLKYNTTTDEKSRLDTLIGVEYAGVKDITISVEVANRHIFDYETQMFNAADFVRKNEMQTALRTTYVFDHDNASFTYLISMFGYEFQDGGFQRAWLDYDVSDTVQVSGGFIDYMGGEKPYFDAISTNDRIFFDIKYSF